MATQLQRLDMSVPLGSLESYIYRVNQIPMLSADEERELAYRFRENGDLDAARQLVLSQLRFVVRVAKGYMGYGLSQADLIQEGNIGLMKAVKRFDPGMGVRLISFAVHWIKAEIHEFVLRNWRIVKVATTKAQRKLFFNLRKLSKHLGWLSQKEINEVANDLNVSVKEVCTMETRLSSKDESFDVPVSENNSDMVAPVHYLEDNRFDPAHTLEHQDSSETRQQSLKEALVMLDERSQDILNQRWLAESKATLHELAAKYGVSAERIRQLEDQAIKKLHKIIVEK